MIGLLQPEYIFCLTLEMTHHCRLPAVARLLYILVKLPQQGYSNNAINTKLQNTNLNFTQESAAHCKAIKFIISKLKTRLLSVYQYKHGKITVTGKKHVQMPIQYTVTLHVQCF